MPRLAVLGSLHMDVLVNAPDRPRKGETLAGTRWWLQAGGKGGNQACQAARLGADVYMIGRVGIDDFGEKLLQALKQAGVNTEYVYPDDSGGSGMSVAIIDEQGDYGAIIVSGVNQHIGDDDLQRAAPLIASADCLVLQYEIPLATNWQAARMAQTAGTRVILNAAPAYPTDPQALELVDLLVVNEIEAEMLSGMAVNKGDGARQAAAHLLRYVPAVVITLGSQGVWLATRDGLAQHLRGHAVKLVDAHGAGDAFIAALALRLSSGATILEAVRYANAAGALACTYAGPTSDLFTAAAVEAILAADAKQDG